MDEMEWRRFLEAGSAIEQDLATSIDAAAVEGSKTGPVPVPLVRMVMEELEEEWRSA